VTSESLGPGDVVVVPFPYTDRLAEKRRPALVISTRKFHAEHDYVWVLMITSAENSELPSDIALPEGEAALPAASVIRVAKVATVEHTRILRKLGTIKPATAKRVGAALAKITGRT
jgi:mRNA interferase MazF